MTEMTNEELLAALKGIRELFSNNSPFYISKLGGLMTNGDEGRIDRAFIAVDAALAKVSSLPVSSGVPICPEGKVSNYDTPETMVDHIVGMVADDGSITDYARGLAIDYIRTRLKYAAAPSASVEVAPQGKPPKVQECGSPLGSSGYLEAYCSREKDHTGDHQCFTSSAPSTGEVDMEPLPAQLSPTEFLEQWADKHMGKGNRPCGWPNFGSISYAEVAKMLKEYASASEKETEPK